MQDHIPNRNYLAAQNKVLIQAGDTLASLVSWLPKEGGAGKEAKKAIRDWAQAKENLMGLAGK